MSDVDVEDNDIILIRESPERLTDVDVEAVTDEEIIADSEDDTESEINVEETDDDDNDVDVESVSDHGVGAPRVLPSGEVLEDENRETNSNTSNNSQTGVITLPPLPSLNVQTDGAETSVESITNITIQSDAVTSINSVHNITMQPVASTSMLTSAVTTETSDSIVPSSTTGAPPGTPQAAGPAVRSIQSESPGDFRSPKRRRIMTPEKTGGDDCEDEGNCCSICFEEWTSSGNHRLASLKCGHLFGYGCIDKWLKGQGGKCPQCNSKAKRQDIRVLYAKCLKVVDTTERDRALKELEKEKEARRRCEMDAAQIRMQYQLTVSDNNKLRAEIAKLREQNVRIQPSQAIGNLSLSSASDKIATGSGDGQFVLDKTIKIWDGGNCRVMAYCPSVATLVVSQPSASPLFPGFGIKKISTLDFKTSQYLTIHSKTIRDVSFHPNVDDGILLSCALDKTVKMTSVISNAVVQTYETQLPSWSCVWNADDRNIFYAGMQNGRVLEFDVRNTAEHVQELNTEGSRSPVASLQYVPTDMNAMFRCGGLLVGQLDKVSFYEKKQGQYRLHILPVEGSLSCQSFEPTTRHLLCSFKPSQKHPSVRHQLCELNCVNISADPTALDMTCSCDIVQTFHAGRTQTLLSKSLLLPHPSMDNNMMVFAGDESTQSLHVWDCGTSQLKQRLRTEGAVLDICSIKTNQFTYIAALTDKILKVFKWSQ